MGQIAKKTDWKTEPMPVRNATFQFKRKFTKEQMVALMKGNIPQEMEDKWFWYYEDGKLYAHRSWTGFCIYIIKFEMNTGIHTVIVNRNPEQYKCTDISEDIETLNHLLDWWTQPQYDYYNEWLSETVNSLMKQSSPQTIQQCIVLDRGDITKLDCDCIVNAANKSLLGGGGVDGAIHRAAGKKLLDECRQLHGCATGEAKITGGYNLKAKYIIHTVGPVYSGSATDAKLLADCYRNSLNLAKRHDIHSIAFPAISTGVYGYPLDKAAAIAVQTIRQWFDDNGDYDLTVILSCFSDTTYNVYDNLLN